MAEHDAARTHQPPPKKVLLDLKRANRAQLLEAGVVEKNIFVTELCTSCDVDRLFSYRKEGAMSGRLLAAVGIRGMRSFAWGSLFGGYTPPGVF